MILFTILAIALLCVLCLILFIAIGGGAVTLAIFGDAIVCGLLIWVVVKLLTRKKKNK